MGISPAYDLEATEIHVANRPGFHCIEKNSRFQAQVAVAFSLCASDNFHEDGAAGFQSDPPRSPREGITGPPPDIQEMFRLPDADAA